MGAPIQRLALLALLSATACAPDDWRYRPYPDAAPPDSPPADVSDASAPADVSDATTPADVTDASAPADVTDASTPADAPDAPPPALTVRGGITTLGTVSSGSLRVRHSLESVARTCTPDRSLCVTGGIAP